MSRRYVSGPVAALFTAAALAGAAWMARDDLGAAWWLLSSQRALTEKESHDLDVCDNPGWIGLIKVLEQDLEVACGPAWLAQALGAYEGEAEKAWLHRLSAHPGEESRTRLRASMGLLWSGETVPGLGLLASEPSGGHERAALVELMAQGDVSLDWADPTLRGEVAVWRLASGDTSQLPDALRRLQQATVDDRAEDATHRAWLAEVGLRAVGLGFSELSDFAARREAGLPLQGLPPHLLLAVANRTSACAEPSSVSCVELAAELLELELEFLSEAAPDFEDEDAPNFLPVDLPRPLWELLYDGDPERVRAAEQLIGATAAWIAGAPLPERSGRLLGLVAHPRHTHGAQRVADGHAGDPVDALRHRRSEPWTTALTAMSLGLAAGVEVAVSLDRDGVVLRVGDRRVALAPCGQRRIAPEELDGAPWPPAAVLAQAAVEAVGALLRRGEPDRARRVAALASRLDSLGTNGLTEALERRVTGDPVTGPWKVGFSLGLLVAPAPIPLEGADTSRAARSLELERVLDGTCPMGA